MKPDVTIKIEKLISLLILGLVFILPLATYSRTASPIGIDGFNKSYLLWLVMPFLLAAWLFIGAIKNKFEWRRTSLDIPIFILIVAFGLSTFFSLDVFSSLFGAYSAVASPFLSTLALVMLFYIIIQLRPGETYKISIIRLLFILYGFMVIVLSVLIFGVWSNAFGEGNTFVRLVRQAWGSVEDSTLLLALLGLLVLGILNSPALAIKVLKNKYFVYVYWALFVISFLFVVFSNFIIAWWALLAGSVFILALNIKVLMAGWMKARGGAGAHKLNFGLLVVGLVAVLSVAMLVINYSSIDAKARQRRLGRELKLDAGNSLSVAAAAWRADPVLGAGPEQFSHLISRYRDPAVNGTADWDRRFSRASAYIVELIAGTGLFGLVAYLILAGVIIRKIFRQYKMKRPDPLAGIMAMLIFTLMICQFIYTANIVLYFLFWLFLALFILAQKEAAGAQASLEFKSSGRTRLLLAIATVLLLTGAVSLETVLAKQWTAELIFQNDKAPERLVRAIRLSPWRYQYQVALSNIYREDALRTAAQARNQEELDQVSEKINQAIDWAEEAVRTAPYAVNSYIALATIYRDILPFSPDSAPLAIQAFDKAITLEPSNPVLYNEQGQVYNAAGDTQSAIESFLHAAELKADYFEAELNLAKAYNAAGETGQARGLLNKLEQTRPGAEIYYELGRTYFNEKNFEKAVTEFKKVLSAEPLHANALYSLALAYEAIGDKEQALYYLRKVRSLNPDNEELADKIDELESE